MFKSIKQKGLQELNSVSKTTKKSELVFTQREWDQITELIDILEPFQDYTDKLQGDQVSQFCSKLSISQRNLVHVLTHY